MSMLESLLGSALQGLGRPADAGSANPLLQIVMQLLANSGQGGGLAGLIEQFQRAGLGQQMNSWISTGANLPVSGDQLAQVFGSERLQQMAAQAGMAPEQFGGALAELLPQAVDRATPQGTVPAGGVDDVLTSLSALMPRS